jgi:photosystem II stability/assembly factor-like uncharacterized protein
MVQGSGFKVQGKKLAVVIAISLIWLILPQAALAEGAKSWRVVITRTQNEYENHILPGEGMQHPHSMVRSYSNPNYIYWAHDVGQGWRSRNGGETWERFLAKGLGTVFGQSIEVDPANPNTVFIVVDNVWATASVYFQGLYKSTDGGDSWTFVQYVDYSENDNRWYKHNIAYALSSISGGEAKIWYAAFAGKNVYKSTDGGNTWSSAASISSHTTMYSVCVSPTDSNIVYLGSNLGLYKSTDGGNTLNSLGDLPAGDVTTIQVNYSNPNEIYVVVKQVGLYKSTNGGANFSLLYGSNYAIGCFINQGYPKVIYFLKGTDWASTDWSGVKVSQDGGNTWKEIVSHPRQGFGSGYGASFRPDDGIGAIIPNPNKKGEAVGYAQAYLWKTTNCIDFYHANNLFSGYTWTCRNGMLFDSNHPNRFGFFGADIGLFISENAGKYYALLGSPGDILIDYHYLDAYGNGNSNDLKAGAFRPGTTAFTASAGNVWGNILGIVWSPDNDGPWEKTTKDGNYWNANDPNLRGSYSSYFYNPDDPNELFVADVKSTDGGKTFSSIPYLADNDLQIYGMAKSNPNYLYAMDYMGYYIYRSTDGGDSWSQYANKHPWGSYAAGASNVTDLVFDIDPIDANVIYTLYIGYDLARYDGKSKSWQTLGLLSYIRTLPDNKYLVDLDPKSGYPAISAVVVDPNNNSIIYATVAHSGVSPVYRSIDGGTTWEDISYNLPRADYGPALSINPYSGEVFVGSASGTWVFPPPYNQNTAIYANSVSVNAVLYGDVSGDSEISAYDAALTAQYAVALISLTPDQIKAADVSGDNDVSAYDAALIAQRAVGLIEKFPVE